MAVKDFTFHQSRACPAVYKSGTRFNTVKSSILNDAAINRVLVNHFELYNLMLWSAMMAAASFVACSTT